MLRNSSGFLVLDYEEVIFRSFNSGSIDMRPKNINKVSYQVDIHFAAAFSKENIATNQFISVEKSTFPHQKILIPQNITG